MPMSQRVLRQRLYNVLTEEKGKLHETKIVQLASRFPRAFIKPVPFSSQKLQAFNCFMHVLNLVDRVEPNVFRKDDKTLNFLLTPASLENFMTLML